MLGQKKKKGQLNIEEIACLLAGIDVRSKESVDKIKTDTESHQIQLPLPQLWQFFC